MIPEGEKAMEAAIKSAEDAKEKVKVQKEKDAAAKKAAQSKKEADSAK